MYAYCSNNPVMGYDPTGYVSCWGVIVGAALTVAGVDYYYQIACWGDD